MKRKQTRKDQDNVPNTVSFVPSSTLISLILFAFKLRRAVGGEKKYLEERLPAVRETKFATLIQSRRFEYHVHNELK